MTLLQNSCPHLPDSLPTRENRAQQLEALFADENVTTATLRQTAEAKVAKIRHNQRLTFSAFFPTNHCDSGCSMCGMRSTNKRLHRRFSNRMEILEQLEVLRDWEGTQGVAIVTGEYANEFSRQANAFMVGWIAEQAFNMGFSHVVCNIGSLEDADIDVLSAGWPEHPPVTLSVFQETYHAQTYEKYMGQDFAKSNFLRRRQTLEKWARRGFKRVNPGILLGLGPVAQDLGALATHVLELQRWGCEVWVSFPRLRPAHGVSQQGCSDGVYERALCAFASVFPECPIVLTTRENPEMQARMLPVVGIVSPGSADVAPYTRKNVASGLVLPNRLESSQFVAQDARRPSAVLRSLSALGYQFTNWKNPESGTDAGAHK